MADDEAFKFRLPSQKEIAAFRPSMCGASTVEDHLRNRRSLMIICKSCTRIVEWTPPELIRRFGAMLSLRLADLAPRLSCTGEGGCGCKDVALAQHFYRGDWTWPPTPSD
jgi:hypothetical protein